MSAGIVEHCLEVLDDLPIAEHTPDTAGQTLATFGIFDLAGLRF